jgi:hypothetical protein
LAWTPSRSMCSHKRRAKSSWLAMAGGGGSLVWLLSLLYDLSVRKERWGC